MGTLSGAPLTNPRRHTCSMRAVTTGLLLAGLLAACASSSPPPSHTALPTCTFNIGDSVQPPGSVGARVPELGGSVSGNADKANGGSSSISIDTSKDGVVTITSSKNASSPSVRTCQLPTTPSLPATSAASPVVALWPGQTLADLQTDFTGTAHGPVTMAKAFAVDALGWPVDLPASPPLDPEGDTLSISVGTGNRRCHRKTCPWTDPAIQVAMAQPFNDHLDVRADQPRSGQSARSGPRTCTPTLRLGKPSAPVM